MRKSVCYQSAFASLQRSEESVSPAVNETGLVIEVRDQLRIIEIGLLGRRVGDLPIGLPAKVGASKINDRHNCLCIGPGRWLSVYSTYVAGDDKNYISKELSTTDLSHAFFAIRLSGSRVLDVLEKGIPIDLNSEQFALGSCASTIIGEIGVLIHFVQSGPVFDLYVGRSMTSSFWDWLMKSTVKLGYSLSGVGGSRPNV